MIIPTWQSKHFLGVEESTWDLGGSHEEAHTPRYKNWLESTQTKHWFELGPEQVKHKW